MKKILALVDFYRFIKYLGLIQTLKFYSIKNKTGKSLTLRVKNYKNKFLLRGGTSDFWVFEMNIVREEYKNFIAQPPKTILDGGANIGTASRYWNKCYPEAQIIAVEPDPDNFLSLQSNIEHIKEISSIHAGIWSRDTKLSILNDKAWKYSIRVVEDDTNGSIQAFSIPTLMERFGWDFIDVLKLDVEGSEVEILAKNAHLWKNKVGILILELHPEMDITCSRVLFKTFCENDFILKWRGENIVLIFNQEK